ncbi:uncharacterized protein [Antedon mediterranea]|uniref:uncharacterized protein n=1 Tax=Antedon mediterranea TaxID=105859 RepID=UPI003AF73BCD
MSEKLPRKSRHSREEDGPTSALLAVFKPPRRRYSTSNCDSNNDNFYDGSSTGMYENSSSPGAYIRVGHATNVKHVQGINPEIVHAIKAIDNELARPNISNQDTVDGNVQSHLGSSKRMKMNSVQEREIQGGAYLLRTVEIHKVSGEKLGFYIREGNGIDHKNGIFITRLVLGGKVEESGLLRVGDEVLYVNSIRVSGKTLDEVHVILQIPKRLLITVKSKQFGKSKFQDLTRTRSGSARYSSDSINHSEVVKQMKGNGLSESASPRTNGKYSKALLLNDELQTKLHLSPAVSIEDDNRSNASESSYQSRINSSYETSFIQSCDPYAFPGNERDQTLSKIRPLSAMLPDKESKRFDLLGHDTKSMSRPVSAILSSTTSQSFDCELESRRDIANEKLDNVEGMVNFEGRDKSHRPEFKRSFSEQIGGQHQAANPIRSDDMKTVKSDEVFSDTKHRHILKFTEKKVRKSSGGSRSMDIDTNQFLKYKNDVTLRIRNKNLAFSGMLTLHVHGGRKMSPTLSTKKDLRDLYCIIMVDCFHKAKTASITSRDEFNWDERFELDLEQAQELGLMVYSMDDKLQPHLCHKATIRLMQVLIHQKYKYENQKLAIKLDPRGLLYLTMGYIERQATLKRVPSLDRKGLFGVPLDVAVRREGLACKIPRLIYKCTQEIELRGMSIIGIYRVCGSAKKKKKLHDEFERSSELVDLSFESWPDIHVITGVLKDYLRELPEPLFTNRLCEEFIAFATESDTPLPEMEKVHSMINTLSPANKETVCFIMDHLKFVSIHHESNKMDTHNIAVCFGPVLMCPSGIGVQPQASMAFEKHIEVLQALLDKWPNPKGPRENEDTVEKKKETDHQEEDSCYHSNDDLDENIAEVTEV